MIHDRLLLFSLRCLLIYIITKLSAAATPTPSPTKFDGYVWTATDSPTENWQAVGSDASGNLLVALGAAGVWTSHNGGGSWVNTSLSVSGTHVTVNYENVVVGGSYSTWYSGDSGTTWSLATGLPRYALDGFACSSDTGQYCVGGGDYEGTNSTIYRSTTYGASWINTHFNGTWSSFAISASGEIAYGATTDWGGQQGMIYTSADSGVTWSVLPNSPLASWNYITSDATGTYLAGAFGFVYSTGGIYYSTDSGASWLLSDAPLIYWSSLVSDASGRNLLASNCGTGTGLCPSLNENGQIWLSMNYGGSWTLSNAGNNSWTGVACNRNFTYLAASAAYYQSNGVIYVGWPAGDPSIPTWQPSFSPTATPTISYAPSPLPSTKPTTSMPSAAPTCGNTWTNTSAPAELWAAVASDSSGNFLVGLTSGSGIWLSFNSGSSWQQITGIFDHSLWYRVGMSSTGQYIVAGVEDGSLYYSQNQGTTWLIPSGSPRSAQWNGIACTSTGQYCIAVIWKGSIYYSSTYGKSWTLSSNAANGLYWSDVAISSSSNFAYVTVGFPENTNPSLSNGQIYKSSDYGATWSVLANSPVASWNSITCDSTGAFVVAAVYGGGIWYSTYYGSYWTSSNAPTANWFGLSTDSTGQFLSAMSGCYNAKCTGFIYLSGNYGQTWTISTATPKPYSAIASNSAGSSVITSIFNGTIVRGAIVTSAGSNNNDDEFSDIGGPGGLAGILIGVLIVVGLGVGIGVYYFLYRSASVAKPSASAITSAPLKETLVDSSGNATNPMNSTRGSLESDRTKV